MRTVSKLMILTFAVMLVSPLNSRALAQSQAASGTIQGNVTDASGAVVVDARVTARSQQTGLAREASTNSDGLYRIPLLPVGDYDLKIEKQGFASVNQTAVKLQVGQTVTLDVQLGVAGASETVNVTAESPIVETTRTQVSSTVNDRSVSNLPVNGRNFIDFVLLTPGVVRSPRSGDLSFGGQIGTLNSLQIDGTDNNNNFFGQTLGRTGSGRAPYQFSQDAVQEFQVNSNGYSAEFGRAGGALINVVTKSGTNQFHGAAFEYYRTKGLNANSFFNNASGRFTTDTTALAPDLIVPVGDPRAGLERRPRLATVAHQFGGNIGGPIVKDRAFFFFDYDGQRRQDPIDVVLGGTRVGATDPNFAAQQAALAEIASHTGGYARILNQNVYLLKGDWQITKSNHLTGRYNAQRFTGQAQENSAAIGTPTTTSTFEHSGNSLVKTDTLSFSLATILSNQMINEARFQWARDKEPGTANIDTPEIVISQGGTVVQLGRNNFSPRETTEKRYQFIDNISYIVGRHALKAGVDVNIDRILNFFPGLFGGSYTFNSLADYANRKPARFQQAFAGDGTSGPTTNPDLDEIALFLQDEWRYNPRLTVSAGLRWDRQKMAEPPITNPDPVLAAANIDTGRVPTDNNNFGPRLGFAWNPLASDKLVIRGSYGLFFGRTPAIMLGTAHSQNGIQVSNITFTGTAMPVFPNRFSALPTGVSKPVPNIAVFDPDYVSPYTAQWSLGAEYQWFRNTSITISYLGVRGYHLQRTRDINLLPPVPTTVTDATNNPYTFLRFPGPGTGTTPQLRPFASFGRIWRFESTGNSLYHGLSIQVNKRFSQAFQLLAAFTYARAIDDNPDATVVVVGTDDARIVQNQLDVGDDRSVSVNHIKQRLVISSVWDVGDYARHLSNRIARAAFTGWSLAGIFTAQGGRPFSARVGVDLNNDANTSTDRYPGFGRNTLIGPGFLSLDPRITRNVHLHENARLQFIVEAFNVLNRKNFDRIQNTFWNVTGTFPTQKLALAPGFGTPQTTFEPRIIQLSAKIIF